jgi:activator of HSP90 ATPase
MAKKTDAFVRRLSMIIEPSNFHWVEQNIKDLAEDAVAERIEKLEKEVEELKSKIENLVRYNNLYEEDNE